MSHKNCYLKRDEIQKKLAAVQESDAAHEMAWFAEKQRADAAEAISEGRLKTLNEKAEEAKREWARAENAEATVRSCQATAASMGVAANAKITELRGLLDEDFEGRLNYVFAKMLEAEKELSEAESKCAGLQQACDAAVKCADEAEARCRIQLSPQVSMDPETLRDAYLVVCREREDFAGQIHRERARAKEAESKLKEQKEVENEDNANIRELEAKLSESTAKCRECNAEYARKVRELEAKLSESASEYRECAAELTKYAGKVKELEAKLAAAEKALKTALCIFCGHAIRRDEPEFLQRLREHVVLCEKHPMREAINKLVASEQQLAASREQNGRMAEYIQELRKAVTFHHCDEAYRKTRPETNWADLILKHGANASNLISPESEKLARVRECERKVLAIAEDCSKWPEDCKYSESYSKALKALAQARAEAERKP